MREIRLLLPPGVEPVGLAEVGEPPAVAEEGIDFGAIALAKARAYAGWSGLPTLAEDSGLVVPALGGLPGVRSARWAGPGDADRIRHLLERMRGLVGEDRRAFFISAVAVFLPSGKHRVVEGRLEGEILTESRGAGGFGYDPVFFLPEAGKTLAEMETAEKNAVSHRSRAFRALREIWSEIEADADAGRNPGRFPR